MTDIDALKNYMATYGNQPQPGQAASEVRLLEALQSIEDTLKSQSEQMLGGMEVLLKNHVEQTDKLASEMGNIRAMLKIIYEVNVSLLDIAEGGQGDGGRKEQGA